MTDNPYIKQFPELMAGKTILYVHGFGSSGQSGTVERIRTVMPEARVVAPDLPVHPVEAMQLLRETCETTPPSLIIGTSMGGMYTEMLYGYDRICVNPAFGIADTMGSHGLTGKQQFFSPRRDGVQEFYVDKPLVKAYRTVSEGNFARSGDEGELERIWGLFGDADPVVHTHDVFARHYPKAIPFHGEHRLNDPSFMHAVVPVVRWIDDRQERRERPIVYVGVEALATLSSTSPGQQGRLDMPHASMMKALRFLIEHYQVFFVAPSPSGDADYFPTTTAWLTEHVGVPAWGHTLFTNRRDLLYGDYLISKKEAGDPMATHLEFGSDTFKTWEDLIDYFARLGGQ